MKVYESFDHTLLFLLFSYGNNCQGPIACDSARPLSALLCLVSSLTPFCRWRSASNKPVVSPSYPQSAAFAALAPYSPSSGVQTESRTSVQRGERTHLGRDIVTS